jgi:predicted nucleic acid-binding protein
MPHGDQPPTDSAVLPAFIFDCNLWVTLLTQPSSKLQSALARESRRVIVTSYLVVEILRVLKRLASRHLLQYEEIESLFWDFCSAPFIVKDFQHPIVDSLIIEVKKSAEYRIIAHLLALEVKDVPYIVAAYQHSAILVTNDIRSLIAKRMPIQKHLGIKIISLDEFLAINAD